MKCRRLVATSCRCTYNKVFFFLAHNPVFREVGSGYLDFNWIIVYSDGFQHFNRSVIVFVVNADACLGSISGKKRRACADGKQHGDAHSVCRLDLGARGVHKGNIKSDFVVFIGNGIDNRRRAFREAIGGGGDLYGHTALRCFSLDRFCIVRGRFRPGRELICRIGQRNPVLIRRRGIGLRSIRGYRFSSSFGLVRSIAFRRGRLGDFPCCFPGSCRSFSGFFCSRVFVVRIRAAVLHDSDFFRSHFLAVSKSNAPAGKHRKQHA